MITFTCPHCQQSLTVPDDSAGKKGKCPQCQNIVDIPVTSTPMPPQTPPPQAQPFGSPQAEPIFAQVGPEERPSRDRDRPSRDRGGESVFQKPTMEFVVSSLILGGLAFLGSPWIIAVRGAGVFPAVMLFIGVLGLAGFGLTLAIFAMMNAMNQRMAGFWYVLTALILSGVAVLMGLMMFIGALTISPPRL
jgi:hypothetical protein